MKALCIQGFPLSAPWGEVTSVRGPLFLSLLGGPWAPLPGPAMLGASSLWVIPIPWALLSPFLSVLGLWLRKRLTHTVVFTGTAGFVCVAMTTVRAAPVLSPPHTLLLSQAKNLSLSLSLHFSQFPFPHLLAEEQSALGQVFGDDRALGP